MSYQECIRTVSADDPDASGLVLRLRVIAANVGCTQADDALTWQKKIIIINKNHDITLYYLNAG